MWRCPLFTEVPVLPVVVPLGAVVVALLLWHLHHRRLLSVPRGAVAVALGVYAGGVAANTIFPIYLDRPTSNAEWGAHANLTPLVGYEVADAVMNIGVFVPLGILLALASPASGWRHVLARGTAVSLSIEVIQYVTAHFLGGGHIADVNDFLFNVVGAALGLGVLVTGARVPVLGGLIDRFRWSPRTAWSTPRAEPTRS
jgi:VanZ family protein